MTTTASSGSTATSSQRAEPSRTLRYGDGGEDVRAFQNDLRALKFIDPSISAKGWFGPLTRGALKDWERAHGSTPDAVLTRAEARQLHQEAQRARHPHAATPPPDGSSAPADPPASSGQPPRPPHQHGTAGGATAGPVQTGRGPFPRGTQARYDYLKALTQAQGGTFRTGPNHRNLVAFRDVDSTRANGGAGTYNDTLAMVWRDSAGKPHVKLYDQFNTEPNESMRQGGTLGRVRAGSYDFNVNQRTNGDPCLRPIHGVMVERDDNHDGSFREHHVERGDNVFLFHKGGYSNTYSQGCFTFSPGEWSRFWGDVHGAQGAINVTVVNGKPRGLS